MADTTHIGTAAVLISSGFGYDPNTGAYVFEQTYDGTGTAIGALVTSLTANGARISKGSEGGRNIIRATWNRDPDISPTLEVAADIWDDDTETEIVSLFDTPAAVVEAAGYVSTAQYKKDIEDSIRDGEAYPLSTTTYPVGAQIYSLLARGVTGIPLNRPVLTRYRTFSATYTSRNQMEYRQKVWTTSALISAFSIPIAVQSRLPDNPPTSETPAGTVWGWKLSVDRASYNTGNGKIQETKTWIFDAWYSQFFTVVT